MLKSKHNALVRVGLVFSLLYNVQSPQRSSLHLRALHSSHPLVQIFTSQDGPSSILSAADRGRT